MKYLLLLLFYSAVCKRHKAFPQQSNCMYLRQYRLQFHKLRTTQVCSLLQLCQCKLLHDSENFVWKTIACSGVCDETKASIEIPVRARALGIFTSLMKRHGLPHLSQSLHRGLNASHAGLYILKEYKILCS